MLYVAWEEHCAIHASWRRKRQTNNSPNAGRCSRLQCTLEAPIMGKPYVRTFEAHLPLTAANIEIALTLSMAPLQSSVPETDVPGLGEGGCNLDRTVRFVPQLLHLTTFLGCALHGCAVLGTSYLSGFSLSPRLVSFYQRLGVLSWTMTRKTMVRKGCTRVHAVGILSAFCVHSAPPPM